MASSQREYLTVIEPQIAPERSLSDIALASFIAGSRTP